MTPEPPWLKPFRIVAFDWDGTAVTDRQEDTKKLVPLFESLQEKDFSLVLITGTNLENIQNQLLSKLRLKKNFYLCTNRGSEVYALSDQASISLIRRRIASPEEEQALTKTAFDLRDELVQKTGLAIDVISNRLNRRKVDLIPEWKDPPKEKIDDLLRAVESRLKGAGISGGLGEVVQLAERLAEKNHLKAAHITSDVKHVEIGLTDKSDSIDWVIRELAKEKTVPVKNILVLGDEFGGIDGLPGSDAKMILPEAQAATFISVGVEPNGVPPGVIHQAGGPLRFREILEAVGLLSPPLEPCFLLEEGFNRAREHEIQALFTVSNGYAGTLGSLAEGSPISTPATLLAGTFGKNEELLVLPDWTHLRLFAGEHELLLEKGEILEHRRILDMKGGSLRREWLHRDPTGRITRLHFLRLASLCDRHLLVQATWISPENYGGRLHLESTIERSGEGDAVAFLPLPRGIKGMALNTQKGEVISFLIDSRLWGKTRIEGESELEAGRLDEWWDWKAEIGKEYRLERRVSLFSSRETKDPINAAQAHRLSYADRSLEDILAAHAEAWAVRWRNGGIEIEGDEEAQRTLCFAVHQLIAAANPGDQTASIGARALTGKTYKGHVFWDTEIFMLPFYLFSWPEEARTLLLYRYRSLSAAREKALSLGYRGALFAWESTDDGRDATPSYVIAPDGEVVPILSGQQEHHVSADIAYAVWQYWMNSDDEDFFLSAGAEILIETARFWASRGKFEEDNLFHIRGVMGPDEYHAGVDDNAYTNGLAQWNLERGAETIAILQARFPQRWEALSEQLKLEKNEPEAWTKAAASMYTGFDPATDLFEQFQGYFDLEDLDPSGYRERGAPIDILLGRERIQRSKVLKQADVLMLIHLLWERFSPAVREANFLYYEPKTAHGSSLSPPIHALLAARLGYHCLFERYFRQTEGIDLSENSGNAAGGVHIGALGGLWQAVVFGLGGLKTGEEGISLDPHLPPAWKSLFFPIRWRGRRFEATLSPSGCKLEEKGEPVL